MSEFLDLTGLQHFLDKLKALINAKQDALVSGTNIKTINNQSILGSGNISISGGSGGGATYSLSKSGSTITLTGTDGTDDSVHDSDSQYGIALNNHTGTYLRVELNAASTDATASHVDLPSATDSLAGLLSATLHAQLSATDNWIVETGSNSDTSAAMQWRWIKLDNGYAFAWGYRSLSQTATTTWGQLKYGNISAQDAPFTWSAAPYEWAQLNSNKYFWLVNNAGPTTTKTGSYYAVSPSSQSSARTVTLEVLQIGRWK